MPGIGNDTLGARGTPPVVRHRDIACFDANPEVFFPPPGVTPMAALKLCRRCAHRDECRDWAIETEQHYGVWGGTTAPERQRILAARETP